MDTSNSTDMNFTVADLFISDHPEDRELAIDAMRTINSLVENLKPILRYVTMPRALCVGRSVSDCGVQKNYKVAFVISHEPGSALMPKERALFIDQDGQFLLATSFKPPNAAPHWHRIDVASDGAWPQFNFAEVVEGLRDLLFEAETRQREHLRSISDRRQKLDEIVALLKR